MPDGTALSDSSDSFGPFGPFGPFNLFGLSLGFCLGLGVGLSLSLGLGCGRNLGLRPVRGSLDGPGGGVAQLDERPYAHRIEVLRRGGLHRAVVAVGLGRAAGTRAGRCAVRRPGRAAFRAYRACRFTHACVSPTERFRVQTHFLHGFPRR
jgi:hypothetical protein